MKSSILRQKCIRFGGFLCSLYFITYMYIPEVGVGLDIYTHTTQTLACCRLAFLVSFPCAVHVVDGVIYVCAWRSAGVGRNDGLNVLLLCAYLVVQQESTRRGRSGAILC